MSSTQNTHLARGVAPQRIGGGESGFYGTFRRCVACGSATLLTAAVFLASAAGGAKAVSFVVEGAVQHEQFGSAPRQTKYRFTARSEGPNWSISSKEEPKGLVDEVLAVGNEQGVFITADLASEQSKMAEKGHFIVNRSEGVVMTNTVPNWLLAPELGPIWLTYLSACYLANADPARIPAPVALNVAGGSPLPPFATYYLDYWRLLDAKTGLPRELVCTDDGFLRAMVHGQLAKLKRFPPPFDKGFTNILFRVLDYGVLSGIELPKRSTLEVFWVWQSKLERVHRFTLQSDRFEHAPNSPIPQPSTRGVASVVDARMSTANGSVLIPYLATNRYLEPSELTRLPAFAEAVRRSLTMRPPVLPTAASNVRRFLISGVLLALAVMFLYVLLRKKPQAIKE